MVQNKNSSYFDPLVSSTKCRRDKISIFKSRLTWKSPRFIFISIFLLSAKWGKWGKKTNFNLVSSLWNIKSLILLTEKERREVRYAIVGFCGKLFFWEVV